MAKRIIVTGASGFLARYAARHFSRLGWSVFGLGHGTEAFSFQEWGLSRWQEGSVHLDSLASFIAEHGEPDVVLHCAGSGSVGKSWDNPMEDFQRTAATTAAVIEAIRRFAPGALLLYPSSAAVYGDSPKHLLSEDDAICPMSPYGLHKHLSETLCVGANRIWGLRVAIVRFFSLYGPGLRKQLLWDIVNKLASGTDRLVLDGTGNEERDFFYIDDATRLLECLATRPVSSVPVIVNGSTGFATTVRAAATQLMEAMQKHDSVELSFSGYCRPGDPGRLVGQTDKLKSIGFQPETPIGTGFTKFVRSLPKSVFSEKELEV